MEVGPGLAFEALIGVSVAVEATGNAAFLARLRRLDMQELWYLDRGGGVERVFVFTGCTFLIAYTFGTMRRTAHALILGRVLPPPFPTGPLPTDPILKEEVLCAFRARGCEDCARQGLEFALQARVRGGV